MTPIERTHRAPIDKLGVPVTDAMAARREVGGEVHTQNLLGAMVYVALDLHGEGVESEDED